MKHFILSVIILCACFVQQAKAETYNVETPGSLSALVGDDIDYLVDVTITGTLNLADFECIWRMSKLEKLNLKEAKIQGGEKYTYYTYNWQNTVNAVLKERTISEGLFANMGNIQSIILPDNITVIENSAFLRCKKLETVVLGDKVTTIAGASDDYIPDRWGAFYGCEALRDINFPETLLSIGNNAFVDCRSLTEVSLPVNLVSLGELVFWGCSGLVKVNLPNGLTKIAGGLFNSCTSLAQITLPENVTEIEAGAFSGCSTLSEVNIPIGVTEIKESTFQGTNLTSIVIPAPIKAIGQEAFANCPSLRTVKLPDGLINIAEQTFYNCPQLIEIEMPQSVTTIGKEAFSGTGFTTFTFPASVVSISEGALSGCQSLQKVVFPEGITEIPEAVCAWCGLLTKFNIPKSVKRINDHAFANIPFQSVTIPENVKQVGDLVFSNQLKFVFWDSDAPIRKNSFGHWGPGLNDWDSYGVNPNALFYVSTDAEGFEDCNLIRRGIAENITLHRKLDSYPHYSIYDFYCPKAFKAKKISLTRNFSLESGHGVSAGWESISLPFTVTSITHAVQGECSPFGNEDGKKHFWLKKLAASGFERATAIEANQPYIICIPNNEAYDEEYILTGDITFSAEDEEGVLIPATPEGVYSEGPLFALYPSCSRKELDGSFYAVNRCFQLDGGGHVIIPAGAVFAKYNLHNSDYLGDYVFPFEAYLVTKESPANAPMYYSIGGGDGGDITGLEDILLKENKSLNIYSIDNTLYIQTDRDRGIHIYDITGRTVRQVEAKEGMNTVTGLSKGFYFLEGKKVLIK